ncbi:penicillin-binding protein 1A [Ferrovum sp. JA12]|uniref:penicillin-binding protein 1A n=1 Tax=Ferrovum sp. JA12 TaxID=1356299 RepID=UPI0007147DF3|nr:penicillin-binding protein 1A [Ferrovum sp. JA12]KRH79368.1 penicillin-binding protein 1A [Ferrovum sp. JA12]HQT81831.1 penicillin-binding protein 1A [Ferrovaceae bacterium]HQU06784.1 penicillin-binding protein 1A [Ferrovaceae bacterium]
MLFKRLLMPFGVLMALGLIGAGLVALAMALIYPSLPSLEAMTDYRPKVPLRVFTADNQLIGEFGEEKRIVLKLHAVPLRMRQAILAAEDDRFYQHGAVDYQGILRALFADIFSGSAKEGASTITMQVARNFFLSNERTITRKVSEILLAYKIESNLSKDQILELYINQIYLGQRAYGFGAAAYVYYGKALDQLSVSEMAMLAGLPKAPSRYNPMINPKRAALRQQYVLRRMRELNYINVAEYSYAMEHPGHVADSHSTYSVKADYVAEMVRQYMVKAYGERVYGLGYKVITTLYKANQNAAFEAVRRGVMAYDHRHGYRGPEDSVELPDHAITDADLEDALSDYDVSNGLYPAVVVDASVQEVRAYVKSLGMMVLRGNQLSFAHAGLVANAKQNIKIQRGSIIRLEQDEAGLWTISQYPKVESALVSLDSHTGAIRALVGGFDFDNSKYNHALQAYRQPGSSFKPFIYSAALEKGYMPATLMDDLPLTINDPNINGGQPWQPHNYENEYLGPMPLRLALAKSKNMVAIRLLRAITPAYAHQYITRFGFEADRHPPYLSMALGSGLATPMQMASAYAVFANGGFRIKPFYIDHIVDAKGKIISQTIPHIAGEGAEQVIDERNAFIMRSMLKEVILQGTAVKAQVLGRSDLAGKTGTTNDLVDAWFTGFQPSLVAVAWVGFDKPSTLGSGETGAHAALPIWIDYMNVALRGVPESTESIPTGVAYVPINPATGKPDKAGSVMDYVYTDTTQ